MANGNGNGNGKMSGSSEWVTIACLVILSGFGVVAVIQNNPTLVAMIIGAIINQAGNAQGAKAGAKMPEQAGDPKPGQSTQSTVTQTDSGPAVSTTPPVTPGG